MPFVDWNDLPSASRFWCFVADRPWTEVEEQQLRNGLQSLCEGWAAHGAPVYAAFQLIEQRIVALAADEARTAASGCSIDSRMAALRTLGDTLGIDWLGRMHVYVDRGRGWERLKISEARQAQGRFLDSVASTKGEWTPIRPIEGSWLMTATRS
ncbi:MAG: hypothetical protein ACKOBQ_00350 [Bacteroidota bacterium]